MHERKVLLKCLVGQHNYNLNDEYSDKDYKIFVAPTFDDLYFNKIYATSKIGKTEDYDIHDIRKIPQLFWKSNINFIEILFSNEIEMYKNKVMSEKDYETQRLLSSIFTQKNDVVKMNLPYFYDGCKGMYFNKLSLLGKGTEGTNHLVEKYGYDTKQAMHAYRLLDFITRFADNNFNNFKQAIEYTNNERNFMLGIKNGQYSIDEFIKVAELKFLEFEKYDKLYKDQKPNEELYNNLVETIKNIVKLNIQSSIKQLGQKKTTILLVL